MPDNFAIPDILEISIRMLRWTRPCPWRCSSRR